MRHLAFLLCITTIIACERNEIENDNIRSDYIVIGDSSNCKIEILEYETIGQEYTIISASIDIDEDGLDDFTLYHYRKDTWEASFVNLKCVNEDSYVSAENFSDTTYLQFLMDSMEYDDLYVINILEIFNCNKVNPNGYNRFDSIYNIKSKTFINSFDLEDTISSQALWISDSLQLSLSDYYWSSGMPDTTIVSEIKDTAIYISTMKILDCHLFPNDIVKYIGIKKGERLGWIKISINDNCETIVHEIGLQE